MANNVVSNPGSGGATWATHEVGGVHHSKVKLETDVSGSPSEVSETNPVPVRLNDGSANLNLASLDYDSGAGTAPYVAVGLALPGSGGPVPGGTAANPVMTDPTNLTPTVVVGPTAHDSVVSSSPILTAGRANGSGDPTAVSDGDVCYTWVDLAGRTVVAPNFPPQVATVNQHGPFTAVVTASGAATAIAAPASESIHVLSITAINSDATNDVLVGFYDGGTARIQCFLLKNAVNDFKMDFSVPWKLPAATALSVNLSATANVYLNIHFYIAA